MPRGHLRSASSKTGPPAPRPCSELFPCLGNWPETGGAPFLPEPMSCTEVRGREALEGLCKRDLGLELSGGLFSLQALAQGEICIGPLLYQ